MYFYVLSDQTLTSGLPAIFNGDFELCSPAFTNAVFFFEEEEEEVDELWELWKKAPLKNSFYGDDSSSDE